jgi:opacity protein-like surface antigen
MKRISLWMVLIPVLAAGALAQESRQDVSVSLTGITPTHVSGTPSAESDPALGALVSYRYMLTPRSGLELNYQYGQTTFYYGGFYPAPVYVHTRMQEISGAYVYSRNYGNFNPFVEGGIGGIIFTPLKDAETSVYDVNQNTNIGVFYGAGLAYQISPSFDIRAEYRGLVIKEPSFNITGVRTGIYQNLNNPVIGIAYHF